VIVDVHGASLGPWDLQTLEGAFTGAGGATELPQVPGWDFAGEADDGRRVLGFVAQPWMGVGALAEQMAVPAAIVSDLPDGLSFEQGAALPVSALTAKLVLDTAGPSAGDQVLVTGAAGQVGGYIVQLARRRGLWVIAAVRDADREAALDLGAQALVSTAGDLAAAVHRDVPWGVAACLDTIGLGAAGLAAVRDGGSFVTTVPVAVPAAERGIEPQTVGVQPDPAALSELAQLAAEGELTVRIAETLPLGRALEGYELLRRGGLAGKIVIAI
jgi:NADPH:quinone reductase-like Zn-dependent oxidoreductase